MWSYNCRGKIIGVKVEGSEILVGCSNGWIYLFDDLDTVWVKKLTSTYYRDPYTDVNVSCLDMYGRYVAVGTDFMDGKIYLFSKDGDLNWYRQFMTIVGCWERPDDVVAVSIADDVVAVGSEWINSHLHILSIDGDLIDEREVNGSLKDLRVKDDLIVVGTTTHLYINNKKVRLPVSKVFPDDELIFVSSPNGFYALDIKGNVKWMLKTKDPIFSVSNETVAVAGDTLVLLSKDGWKLWEAKVEKPSYVCCGDEYVYVGYRDCVKIIVDGTVVEEIRVKGIPVHVGGSIVCVEGSKLMIYNEYAL